MIFTDLLEVKALLNIDPGDTSEDVKLNFIITIVSSWLEELMGRSFVYKTRTEYYNGNGTQRLCLRSRPVYTIPPIEVNVQSSGYYGAPTDSFNPETEQIYGESFSLQVDQDDGTSRCGILLRYNDYWPIRGTRGGGYLTPSIVRGQGNIKVTYTAGYTVDTLPEVFRGACNLLVVRMNEIFPLGMELNSESYEERSISVVISEKAKLLSLIKPMIWGFRNWSW